MAAKRLALVEDREREAISIRDWMVQAGYVMEIFELEPFDISGLRQFAPDLVILDIHDDKTDTYVGYDRLKDIRDDPELSHVKVMIFTERATGDADKRKSMHYRANVWYEKVPVDILELYVRNALDEPADDHSNFSFHYDPETMQVFSYGELRAYLKLSPRQKRLMEYLWEHQPKVCSYDELIAHVYQDLLKPEEMSNGAMTALVGELKRKLPDKNIEAVSGTGYRLVVKRKGG